MPWSWLALFLALAWGVQSLLAYRQIRELRQKVADIGRCRRSGFLGVGTYRRFARPGAVVILVADTGGRLVEGYRLLGWSVLARLEAYEGVEGVPVEELARRLDQGAWEGGEALKQATREALDRILAEMGRAAETDQELRPASTAGRGV